MVDDILRHYPDATIDWVVEEAYTCLVKLKRGVRTVIPFALRRWRKSLLSAQTRAEIRAFRSLLQRDAYDYVFDTQGLIKTGVVMGMARLARGGKKVGLANATEGSGYEGVSRLFHTQSIPLNPRTHAVMRARLIAAAVLAYQIDKPAQFGMDSPHLPYTPHLAETLPAWMPQEHYVVFFHGSARPGKKWPEQNWIALGQSLAQHGLVILLPWGNPEEQREAQALAEHLPHARVLPSLTMLEAIILAHHAALVVGVDSGLTHIAAAYLRPTIEIYCDSPRWKTEGDWSSNLINLGDAGAPPSVAEVQAALESLIARIHFHPSTLRTVAHNPAQVRKGKA